MRQDHSIFSKIDQFYKKAQSEGKLEDLLKLALFTGDKTNYLIFLDLLEETSPKDRERLNSDSLYHILYVLSQICPNVIEHDHIFERMKFKINIFSDLKGIAVNNEEKIDELFYPSFRFISGSYFDDVCFTTSGKTENLPIIDGLKISTIRYFHSRNEFYIIPKGGEPMINQKNGKELFLLCKNKALKDLETLKGIFL